MDRYAVLRWLKNHELPNSRDSLDRLMREQGFPRPVMHGRKGDWLEEDVTRWLAARQAVASTPKGIVQQALLASAERVDVDWLGEAMERLALKAGDDVAAIGRVFSEAAASEYLSEGQRSRLLRHAVKLQERA